MEKVFEVNAQTPMLQQYFRAKEAHPGVLMAMRVGDFYEFYGEDAETAARLLEITLTGREDGKNGRISMAGVPFHSVEKYLAQLVRLGQKVALCDQVEDPKKAKGLVRREVTRVLTAGTLMEESMLTPGSNNFLAALCLVNGKAGIATLDSSTGEFMVTEIDGDRVGERVLQELARLMPAEVLFSPKMAVGIEETAANGLGLIATERDGVDARKAERLLKDQFEVVQLGGFGIDDRPGAAVAAGMVLDYARTNGVGLSHVSGLAYYSTDGFMQLDPSTRRSLELTQNLGDGGRRNTLLSVLDGTVTTMGARLLRRWIEQPLLDLGMIRARNESVERFGGHVLVRADLRAGLKRLCDIERSVSRCATGLATPRDLLGLRDSLEALPAIEDAVRRVALGHLKVLKNDFDRHEELAEQLRKGVADSAPVSARDGGVIREGFDLELDALRQLSRDGKGYIARLEAKERAATGLEKLKVGYNSVFGYYLEVSRAMADKVPDHYIRKQTLANAERYITAELKEHESAVLGAEEKADELEFEIFCRLRDLVAAHGPALLKTARVIAEFDCLCGLAEVALDRGYVKPDLVDEDVFEVRSGRHPVVDAGVGTFVPNDLDLGDETRLIVLTGPNMSGKSTFLRQAALIVVMAQIGSFVPAASCRLGLCDRVFTRIGAKDEIALGQSTFMVEMVESANILNNATDRSLVVLDEVGRGTSTFDGLAIAWAMVEYLARTRAKTLFATHYHQINQIAEQTPGVANFRVAVEERGDQIVWAHKVLPGGTDRSYGLHVAKMAGVPPSVVRRAGEVLNSLEGREDRVEVPVSLQRMQLSLFEEQPHAVVEALKELDVNALSPLEALMKLDEWKRSLN
ncbi:DNA mismatch repair protein MutS [Armatimonadetes bacterium Uphvl-Ar1]|nr:DNA mismatch repair protein MutS [Armatimonadetes bacterium Uphvl-Ar1]